MVYLNRIYTRTGDQGETGLGDGRRVPKTSTRIKAMGQVEEVNALLGLVLLEPGLEEALRPVLNAIQNDLFDLGADLCIPAQPDEQAGQMLRITPQQVERLERAIDQFNERLQPLSSFILPGGSPVAARLHLARTVCRRAEIAVLEISPPEPLNQQVGIYLNRLSDLLFVLARVANDDGRSDVLWTPGQHRHD